MSESWYRRYDICGMRQRLRSDWLNDNMGREAKGTIALNCLTVHMGVPDLHDPGANNECTAEEAKGRPERGMCSLIEAVTQHC